MVYVHPVNVHGAISESTPAEAPSAVPAPAPSTLGGRLRALRLARRLSLNDVAVRAQISASFLSLVETDKSDITVGRLSRLVEFYGVAITDILPSSGGEDPDVVRSAEARQLHFPEEGIEGYLLAWGTDRMMMPMLLEFEPGASLAEPGRHPGEEFVHVLEGRLRLDVEGAEPRELDAGDSAYYRADRGHHFGNAHGDQPLRLICVHTPPQA